MKSIVLFVVSLLAPLYLLAGGSTNLSVAIQKHQVRMDAVTTAARYTGSSLRLTLTNTGSSTIVLKVNNGMILRPMDAAYQQLILPGGETVTLKAHETSELDVQIFCSNAVKACPVAGLHYFYFRECGEVMGKVLEYVRANGYFDQLGQAAIWAITNYLPLHCVYDVNRPDESEKLIAHIVAVTKRDKPYYYTTYITNEDGGQRAYLGKADKVYVPFDMNLTSPRAVTLSAYTPQGEFVKTIAPPQLVETGKRKLMAEFMATDLPTGKYAIRVMAGDRMLHERTVFVEQPWITFKD